MRTQSTLVRGIVERIFVMILACALLFVLSLFTAVNADTVHLRNDSVTTGSDVISSTTATRYDLSTLLGMSTGQTSEAVATGEVILAITSVPTTGDPVVVFKFGSTTTLTATQSVDDSTAARTGAPVLEATTTYVTMKGRYLNVGSRGADATVYITRVR